MPQYVTVEGSIRPCQELPRGHRKTVALTDRVQSLITRGFFDLVETHDSRPRPEAIEVETPTESGEPKKTASTQDWKDWFDAQTPPIPYPEDVQRKQLIHVWETMQQARAQAG